jgi:protocatechuate 3,4-dioxygenase beta subunit
VAICGALTQRLAARAYSFFAVQRLFASSLITQMYFPGDPLFAYDTTYQDVPEDARERMVSQFSL